MSSAKIVWVRVTGHFLGRMSVTMLRVGFVTFYSTFLFSALFYKKFTPSTARTKLSAGPAADGDAASVNAQMPPFLTCGWLIHHRILLSVAQFLQLCWSAEQSLEMR